MWDIAFDQCAVVGMISANKLAASSQGKLLVPVSSSCLRSVSLRSLFPLTHRMTDSEKVSTESYDLLRHSKRIGCAGTHGTLGEFNKVCSDIIDDDLCCLLRFFVERPIIDRVIIQQDVAV
jgi:hypothetical protein